jgi:P-type conjugative transfer ATPase TrbB
VSLHEAQARLHDQLTCDLGVVIGQALRDVAVTEIKVGEDGVVWLRKHVVGWEQTGDMLSEAQRTRALNSIASLLRKTINERSPNIEGALPLTGDRVAGSVWPSSAPSFFIRRHAPRVFTLSDYVVTGIVTAAQAMLLAEHVHKGSNIVISGATDSGKTTMVNALLHLLNSSSEHLVIIEDTREIQCTAPNHSRFLTSEHVSMLDQIKASMRRAPDRLIIGETRDAAGFALLKSWSTGHRGGMTTVHANNAAGVFDRFAQFCEEAGVPAQWRLMQQTIDVVAHMEKTVAGRRVMEIKEVSKDVDTTDVSIKFTQRRRTT